MARTTPRVAGATLVQPNGEAESILVGTPAWYAWLEQATTFAFAGTGGSFTARRERPTRAGGYWKAYRKQAGQLRSAYLGKAADLTLERLNTIAATLAAVPAVAEPEPAGAPLLAVRRTSALAGDLPTGTVTFLCTDIAGSTTLWEQYPQAMARALARHDAILRRAIAVYGGVAFKMVGDGLHAVFTRASDALAAALTIQRALHVEPWDATGLPAGAALRVRVALHTGVAELRDDDYFGPPLNRVARILAAGHGGQTLLSHATAELVSDLLPQGVTVRDLGAHQLKDLRRPEQLFQLVSPDLPADFPALRTQAPAPAAATLQLLTTKLYVPPARPNLVPRPHLVDRLRAGLTGRMTLIAAPAGFGKTTLLASWIQERVRDEGGTMKDEITSLPAHPSCILHPFEVAWVSLDAADNDPTRFWTYLIGALELIAPGAGEMPLALLQAPQPPAIDTLLATLVNAIGAAWEGQPAGDQAVLVLDDYHVITAPPIHAALAQFIDYLPAHLHLVIATRSDPPLPLARWRARGELTELRAADLCFTHDEAATFLTDVMGLALSAADVAALAARTEGWIAGLHLAALAMRKRTDLAGFVAAFAGSTRFVIDYLIEEVFQWQPAHIQQFLLQTAILDRMCGPLCDAVLGMTKDERPNTKDDGDLSFVLRPSSFVGDSYSQLILDQLERANLFLVPLDDERRWYRYHHLFAEVLRERLTSGAPATTVRDLQRRASRWCEQQQLVPEAIDYALRAGAWDSAARLIETHAITTVLGREAGTLGRWLNALPPEVRRAHPRLLVAQAWEYLSMSDFAPVGALLVDAEAGLAALGADAQALRHEIDAIRVALRMFGGDPRAIAVGQQTLDNLPEQHPARRAMAGWLGYALFGCGDLANASRILETALVSEQERKLLRLALMALLAVVRHAEGRLSDSLELCRATLRLAEYDGQLLPVPSAAMALMLLGIIGLERNDLAGAEQCLRQSTALAQQHSNTFTARQANYYLGLVQEARGDLAGALRQVEDALSMATQQAVPAITRREIEGYRAILWLRQGRIAEASRWAAAQPPDADRPPMTVRDNDRLAFIRLLIAERRWSGARRAIGELGEAAERTGHGKFVLWSLVLQAVVLWAQGDLPAALAALKRALTLAEPEGYVRVFVDEGAPMAALLREAHAAGIAPDYTARLLAAFPDFGLGAAPAIENSKSKIQNLTEPLSDREVDVLRLIAAGRSNQEIADTLVIAVGTVKKHINNIYGKLAVQSRTQALLRARELDLL